MTTTRLYRESASATRLSTGSRAIRIPSILAFVVCLVHGHQIATSQKSEALRIHGKVIEFGTSQGISDVQVTVERYERKPDSSLTPRIQVGSAGTDINGAFAFTFDREGTYRVSVRKDGYVLPGSFFAGFKTSAEVSLGRGNPDRELLFQLGRPAKIVGRVVDDEARNPVPGVPVSVAVYGYLWGHAQFVPGGFANTDAGGRFTFGKLVPADYLVIVGPRMRSASVLQRSPELNAAGAEDRLLTEFSEDDLKAVDYDYDATCWPGGADLHSALPLSLISGADVDLGQMRIRKVPKYRVLFSVAENTCTEGDVIQLSVRPAVVPQLPLSPVAGTVACGKAALLRGFTPGLYDIEAQLVSGANPKVTATAYMQFNVAEENTAISVPVLRGVVIDGQALFAEGARKTAFAGIRVLLQPVDYGAIRHALIPLDSAGSFRIEGVGIRDYRMGVSGIPKTHYLKEVRYNGQRASNDIVSLAGRDASHSLELVFDDKPATLMGSITERGKPVGEATVILVRWPYKELIFSMKTATSDENGRFTFSGLPPGDYRALAVSSDARGTIDRPGVLEHLLNDTEDLSLGQSQIRNVTLELARP